MNDISIVAGLPQPGLVPDFARALPATSVAKLMKLIEAATDAHVPVAAFSKKVDEARNTYQKASADHARLEEAIERGYVIRETVSYAKPPGFDAAAPEKTRGQQPTYQVVRDLDHTKINESQRDVASIKAEFERLTAKLAEVTKLWTCHCRPLSAVEKYLRSLPVGSRLTAAASPAARQRKPSDAEIAKAREIVASLKAELADVVAAPIPSSEAKAAARKLVLDLAQKGAPRLFDLAYGAFRIEFPTVRRGVDAHGQVSGAGGFVTARGSTYQVDPLAVLAWQDPEKMIAALDRDIDEIADDKAAIDASVRASREKEIAKRILAAERDEEALIEQGLAAGLNLARRLDMDPRAILGIEGPAPEID
ncbi:MAG: hypothetical protein EOS36_07330 [Mesorhizobium sp.]|uniref:hypothetical protein n=1 Tax=Mesorhizobium sp. TaxID=1871066 RepID=UPI000FE74863|nr:hypothetical protein [Mesorhizobium sp.]RWD65506.1 MAG: hypothetical protein EOS36_07330 [Mesorhizobium sp.]